jgi:manganese/iron transport system permease protein
MDWLVGPFEPAFMQRALLAGALVAAQCALVGVWIVLRRLGFLGDALAHGVVPGIAIALLIGLDATVGAAIAAVVVVAGVSFVRSRTGLSEDTSIGLLFVGLLALGVVIISRAGSFAVDLTAVLFGSVLGVSWGDIAVQVAAVAVALVATLLFYRGFLALAFDERKAQVLGLHPALMRVVLLGLIALSVVTSFEVGGALLGLGLLIAPAAAAALIARRVVPMMLLAAAFGIIAVVVGLLISFHFDLAAGAAMVVASVAIFFGVLAIREAHAAFLARRRLVLPAG